MQLEQLVPSLELCKELKENGYPQDTYFHRVFQLGDWHIFHIEQGQEWSDGFEDRVFAAPTASEILDRLPVYVQFEKHSLPFSFRIDKTIGGEFPDEYEVLYYRWKRIITDKEDNYQERGRSFSESLASAGAKMWLYLNKMELLTNTK